MTDDRCDHRVYIVVLCTEVLCCLCLKLKEHTASLKLIFEQKKETSEFTRVRITKLFCHLKH